MQLEYGVFAAAGPRRTEMNEKKLASEMDRILVERLREIPAPYSSGPLRSLHRTLYGIRKLFRSKPEASPNTPWQWEIIGRFRSLPSHVQDPIRRYFVFQEAEESICHSLNMTPRQFRRFLRDAAGYILMRHERMPRLNAKAPPGAQE
jgi:hypothetical protein